MTVADRSKAAVLGRTLVEREAEADALNTELVELEDAERQAIREALERAPGEPVATLNSPVARARDRIERAKKRLGVVERELPVLRELAAAAAADDAESRGRQAIKGLGQFATREAALMERVRAAVADIVAVWITEAPKILDDRDEYLLAARHVAHAAGLDREFEQAVGQTMGADSLPADLYAALTQLVGEVHHADFAGDVADAIKANPRAIRKFSFTNVGPGHDASKPTRFQWIDLDSCPLLDEPKPGGGSRPVPDVAAAKVRLDREPHADWRSDARWRRVVVQDAA